MTTYLTIQAEIYLGDAPKDFTPHMEDGLDELADVLERLFPSAWTMSSGFTDDPYPQEPVKPKVAGWDVT